MPDKSSLTKKKKRNRRPYLESEHGTRTPGLDASGLAQLQRQLGNRAVQRLVHEDSSSSVIQAQTDEYEPGEEAKFPSGASWIDRFKISNDLDDLDDDFGENVENFVAMVEKAGAEIEIASTLHPIERAYLMHWSYRIAKEGFNPKEVPELEGVDIRWWHGDINLSRAGAWEMVKGFKIGHLKKPPPIISPYTLGQVLAATVRWSEPLIFHRDEPDEMMIESGPNNATNVEFLGLAQTYELEYLLTIPNTDEVHWTIPPD